MQINYIISQFLDLFYNSNNFKSFYSTNYNNGDNPNIFPLST